MPDVLSHAELVPDTWLAQRLGRGVYRLAVHELLQLDEDEADGCVAAMLGDLTAAAMVYAKVPVAAVNLVSVLRRRGFNLVDTNITLERARFDRCDLRSGCTIRLAQPADERQVVELARRSFECSRFHRDPRIGNETANMIKAQWVANYFRGRRGDQLVVAESGMRVVGFLLALLAADGAMVIDLVAVDERRRGRGIACDMTWFASDRFPCAMRLRVGTQLANEAALRTYQNLRFTVTRAAYVLHLHLD